MRTIQVTITMPDGSKGRHCGAYPSAVAALQAAFERFPQARRVSAQVLQQALPATEEVHS